MAINGYIDCPDCGMENIRPRGLKTHQRSTTCLDRQLVNRTRQRLTEEGFELVADVFVNKLIAAGVTVKRDLSHFVWSRRRWVMEASFYAPAWAVKAIATLWEFIGGGEVARLLSLGGESLELKRAVAAADRILVQKLAIQERYRLLHLAVEIGPETEEFGRALNDAATYKALQDI